MRTFSSAHQNANIKVPTTLAAHPLRQIKRWMLRDSNFSPDFPYIAQKLSISIDSVGATKFDAVIAANSDIFSHLLDVTGRSPSPDSEPSQVRMVLSSREAVERITSVTMSAELKQNRKNVMKQIAAE